ncbi:DUF6404 family protein [Cognatiluteimonas weifangensis]|uniref:DUF6404 family protein n=1 Tax=Cognatiluteimonas weifangensis TaxID=2303539 RepID=UPI003CCC9520
MRMTHTDKLERMQKHMAELGVSPSTAAPPIWKLLWRLGIDLPPPLFMGFLSATFFTGSLFGILWGLFMWLLMWSRQGVPTWLVLSAAASAGVLFGLCMATYFRYLARKHNLPSWATYTGPQP